MCNTPMQAKDSSWVTFIRNPGIRFGGILLAAFLGAYFGYLFTVYEHAREVQERRHTLINLLNRELAQLPNAVQPYDKTKAFYRDPLRLISPTKLIDGDTLQYQDDARLLETLLNLNVVISRHNDFVQVTNLAQATTKDIPDTIHAQWYSDMKLRLADVVKIRDEVLQVLKQRP